MNALRVFIMLVLFCSLARPSLSKSKTFVLQRTSDTMTVSISPQYASCQPSTSSSDGLCGLSASPRIRKVLSKKAKKAEKNTDEKEALSFAKQIRDVLKRRLLNRLKKMFSLSGTYSKCNVPVSVSKNGARSFF